MGVFDLRIRVLAGSLALGMLGTLAGQAGQTQTQAGQMLAGQTLAQAGQSNAAHQNMAQQGIPDAPKPQTTLPNLGPVAPGQGTTPATVGDATPGTVTAGNGAGTAPAAAASSTSSPAKAAEEVPAYEPPTGEAAKAQTLVVHVNDVNVPFTVKDSKGQLVAGLTGRDVQVFENGVMQRITRFTNEAQPLSVALVIDQSMTYDNVQRLNISLGALQGAFAPYDAVSVFTYNNGPKMVTDFTGAQSARLTQAIEISKGEGREPLLAGALSGPMSQTTVINNQNFDPNTAAVRGHTGIQLNPPKEQHTLNDAILEAAKSLSNQLAGRRRIIYVISDGKEYGSTAKFKDVVKYLQTNEIEVDGTLVGDSSLPLVGYLDRFHLPLTMHDNLLPAYANATGGIEKSFARIVAEVRNRYTLDYVTHEPLIDGKYRTLEVRVINHGNDLTIIAKKGYWPSALLSRPLPATAQ
jgi:Tfp pilus assembly protein PilW